MFKKLPAGESPPDNVNVVIEIAGSSAGGSPVKYEVSPEHNILQVDRILQTSMFYPCNYGFIPSTLHEDGDPVDMLVMTDHALMPGSMIACRPVAILWMEDDGGQDDKILCVPNEKVDPFQANIKDLEDVSAAYLNRIAHFFEKYKDLDKGKWAKVRGWGKKQDADKVILEAMNRFLG